LKKEFWFVGLTARYNEGLILLKHQFQQLGISFNIYYEIKNKGPKTTGENNLVTDQVLQNIRDQNRQDLKIFEHIVKVYEENTSKYPGDIKKDLLRFEQKLSVWKTYHSIVPKVVKRAVRSR
jgi:hypothetical protein